MAKLGDICLIQSGGTPLRSERDYWSNGTVPWVKISDFNGKYLTKTEELITTKGLENSSAKLLPKGTILYTIFATLGEVCILNIDATTNQAIAGLQLLSDEILPEYLYYYLLSKKKYVNELGRGVAQNNINLKILKELEIPLPPIEKQEKIADMLNTVNNLLELRKQQFAKLDELVKARFVEMFGDPATNPKQWRLVPLLEMGDCKNGMNFHDGDSGITLHCLGVGDFKNLSKIHEVSALSQVSLNEVPSDDYLLKDGDIVFVRSNGNKALVGRCVAVYPGSTQTTFSGFCIRYRRNSDMVMTDYLLQVLKSDSMRKKMAGRGANIQNLNQQILSTLLIPVPPKEAQNEFADFVTCIEKTQLTIRQGLYKLEMLKKALIQEYFGS